MQRVKPRSSAPSARAFHPAYDRDPTSELLVHDLYSFDPVMHAAAAQRVGNPEVLQA